MGKINSKKLILLIFCFSLISVFIHRTSPPLVIQKKTSLPQALANIGEWNQRISVPLNHNIINNLQLDDYLNSNYSNGNITVSVFIGYYLSKKKVGAAHSPLVCFPGQGWVISNAEHQTFEYRDNNINCMSMVVSKGQKKQFVIYWFQAGYMTSAGTFLQKIYTLFAKFRYHKEENAFVRITIPMEDATKQRASLLCAEFIEAFYPPFFAYIKGN